MLYSIMSSSDNIVLVRPSLEWTRKSRWDSRRLFQTHWPEAHAELVKGSPIWAIAAPIGLLGAPLSRDTVGKHLWPGIGG